MATALASPSWNHKKKTIMVLCFGFMPQLNADRATLFTNTKNRATALTETAAHGNGSILCDADVRKLCERGQLKEVLQILHIMCQRGTQAESNTYGVLLQWCLDMKALPQGRFVHAHLIQTGFIPDISLGNKLVTIYAKFGSLMDARRVLEEMPKRNVVSWTAMITAYARHGRSEEALALFYQMQRAGIEPDPFAFASVLPACANLAALEHGKEFHEDIVRSGFMSNVFIGSALVDMYAKCGSIENAHNVFDKMPERNMVSWTAMIGGYAQNGHVDDSLKLFQKMPEQGRDVVLWNVMIAGYAQNGQVDEALKLFEKTPQRNLVSWNGMLAGYAQNGRIDGALKLFQKMPGRDMVSWSTMISGYMHNGDCDEALKLFWQMQVTGVQPNSVIFASILPACANLAALQAGKKIHEDIIRSGFQSAVIVGNALVDMYAKCGSIEDARDVFDKMLERDLVSWTVMIAGYALHGHGKEAIQLFEQMQRSGIQPDHVTFLGVLSGCCHAGLVDDGWKYFNRMSQDYHIAPAVEHYCCMVDLLGRAGHLHEAHNFINKMPIEPNAAVWGSLLAACRIHGDIELGEHVAERLFELDPRNSAHYVLLSNIYAASSRWDAKEKVSKIMEDRRVKRRPGCSWIEINNTVHTFLVGDRSHPQMQKVYAKLKSLFGQMKEAGYVADRNFVLHDVEEEQKEHILNYHSEKLAIAFGLINASPGTVIQIVKNLRVCGDCHSFTKFISKIVTQKIVVRDASRFHHFKDGQCSCGDYW